MRNYIRRIIACGFILGALLVAPALAHGQTALEFNQQGVDFYESQRWNDAVVSFESAYRIDPDNQVFGSNLSKAVQAEARALIREKSFDEAVDVLIEAIRVIPESAGPLIMLGECYLIMGNVRYAIFRLEEAIELDNESIQAHYLLGEAYFKDHDVESALDQWDWVFLKKPDYPGLADRLDTAYVDHDVESGFRKKESANFTIRYSRKVPGRTLRHAVDTLETAYRDIGQALNHAYPPPPIAVTLYTAESFGEATQMGEHVGALYDGARIRCPVVDANGRPFDTDEIERRLVHEYVHVVVRFMAQSDVPWWFNEGLAETLSQDLSQRQRRILREAWENGQWIPLSELEDSQLEVLDVDNLQLAYLQSHATVTYLQQKFKNRRLGELLSEFASGENAEDVLRRVCRRNYSALLAEVADSL